MITLERVSKTYQGRHVLHEVDHVFASGGVTVVRGPSGIGKSTVLNLVAGYVTPDSGAVHRDGSIGYLMQDELIFSKLTVTENLMLRGLGFGQSPGRTRSLVETTLPLLGIDHLAGAPAANLSGGERRRVEIAGILLGEPQILLLDEPTANLDPASAASIYAVIWDLRHGRTLLLVTHDVEIPALPSDACQLALAGGRLSA